MPKIITGTELIKLINENKIITGGMPENCDSIKYDFVLDSKFLKAQFGAPISYDSLQPIDQKEARINSGEVVFVLTRENVNLPSNMFMLLSHKRGMVDHGILTLGGLTVDPEYSGKLVFGLYNFSSRPFTLLPGRNFVSATLFRLDEDEMSNITTIIPPKSISDFSPRLIEMIQEFSPIGLSSLEESVREIKLQIDIIKRETLQNKDSIIDLNNIIRKTREDIDENNVQIKKLSDSLDRLVTSLDQETALRKELRDDVIKNVDDSLKNINEKVDEKIKMVDDKIKYIKGALWLATALGGIFITLLITWLAGWLKIN